MDHSLGCQDAEYDQTGSGSAISKLLRSTYHAPPAELHTAYASLNSISTQRMPLRTTMSIREPLYSTSTSHTEQHSSGNPIRRSVLGMKNLLPLKLLSPTPSEEGVWPSSAPSHRTTFGMRLSLRVEGRRASMNEHTESQSTKPSARRLRRNRDTPIYTEPGTPLPSPAYFTNDDVCQQCSPPGSVCDEACIINDYDNEMRMRHEHELGDLQETIENMCDGDDTLLQSFPENTSRCSDLSFQCSGEDMFPDEAVWLRSPLNIGNWPRPNALHAAEMDLVSAEHSVESWLSDTSSYFDQGGGSLACATVLAPAKASVVTLSPSSGLAISIPPRLSSLDKPAPLPFQASNSRDSWFSFTDSPPITPADLDNSNPPSRESSLNKKFQPSLPRRRLDLAMTSPPLSPRSAALITPNLSPSPTSHKRSLDVGKPSWPLTDTTPQEPTDDILSSLEEWTSNFPSTMLLQQSDIIPTIRSQLSQAQSHMTTFHQQKPPAPLLSAFSLDSASSPPRMKSLRRCKTTDLSRHRQGSSTSTQHPPFPSHSSSSSHKLVNAGTLSPDLQPIQNIFPNSSKTMRSALYAHVLAYIFVTSSLKALPSIASPKQRRRNIPYWNTNSSRMTQKAADLLGIAPVDAELASDPLASERATKMQGLQEDLRKCIFCLISVMDDKFEMENMMGSEQDDIERSSGMILLRCLVEVVRSSEERSHGFF